MIEALGSSIPKTTFVPLVAGWEEFNKNGKALPDDTVRYVSHSVRGDPNLSCSHPPCVILQCFEGV